MPEFLISWFSLAHWICRLIGMLIELVTRSGGGECDSDDGVVVPSDVDFFLRFFLPSPLPIHIQVVDCVCRLQCCIGVVGGANESRKQGNSSVMIIECISNVGLICIVTFPKHSRSS